MKASTVIENEFLGLRFARMDETGALGWVLDRSRRDAFSYVVTPDVDQVVQIHREPQGLSRAYDKADLRLCDSRVVALMGRCNGIDLPVVTGSGLTARLLSKPLPAGTRIAVIGGNERQHAWLAGTQPDAEFVFHVPPMGLRRNVDAQIAVAKFVEEAQADIVLITVGAPQSELIASLIASRGRARGVALCVGASLEFITGEKRRAPTWMQKAAMEWAFRLFSEPRRLSRRYLVDGPQVFSIWMRWMAANRRPVPVPAQATILAQAPAMAGAWTMTAATVGDTVLEPALERIPMTMRPEILLAPIAAPSLAASTGAAEVV